MKTEFDTRMRMIREAIMVARTGDEGVPNEGERFTLADVLLLPKFQEPWFEWETETNEQLKQIMYAEIISRWNLRNDDLKYQSEETLSFLASLLK